MRRPDAVIRNISRKELVFCGSFHSQREIDWCCSETAPIAVIFYITSFYLKTFTVVQPVGRQHFISEARDRFPVSPWGGLVVDSILLGEVLLRVSKGETN